MFGFTVFIVSACFIVIVGYPGDFVFDFQKAFTGWYIGKRDQSKSLFLELGELKDIPQNFKEIISENIRDFGLQYL